jgi:hypothetical protein
MYLSQSYYSAEKIAIPFSDSVLFTCPRNVGSAGKTVSLFLIVCCYLSQSVDSAEKIGIPLLETVKV